MKTKHWTKVKEFEGYPKLSDFKIVEEDIEDNLQPSEILTEALAISVDPYIRVFPFPPGTLLQGYQVSRVIKSANEKFPEESIVMFHGGWKTICKTGGEDICARVDDIKPNVETTHAIGCVGMTGASAYTGLKRCNVKKGETLFVSACAGAVGNMVGQIAKAKDPSCKVIGSCGSDEKVTFAKSVGFDDAFNYKTETSWPDALKKIAPEGIDCFFDNVGGQLATDVMNHMNEGGRVTVCGYVGSYNDTGPAKADIIQPAVLMRGLTINSFKMMDLQHHRPTIPVVETMTQLSKLVSEEKIKPAETVTEGFENIPKAFIGMMKGENIGKALVRVAV